MLGGGSSLLAVVASVVTRAHPPGIGWLLAQPAAITVPLAFTTMVIVSLLTRRRIAPGVDAVLARFHLPIGARVTSRQQG